MVHAEWAPSAANPADIPTRLERAGEMPRSAVCVEMNLPPIEEVEGNVAAWISQVRATYA